MRTIPFPMLINGGCALRLATIEALVDDPVAD